MSGNREEILADFQACTGIEDVGEALMYLENANWDLTDAVNRALPNESGPSNHQELLSMPSLDDSIQIVGESFASTSNHSDSPSLLSHLVQSSLHSSSSSYHLGSGSRMLNFTVTYKDKRATFSVAEDQPVRIIKSLIHAQLHVPACKQELFGWNTALLPRDDVILENLSLPRDNILHMTVKDDDLNAASDEATARFTQTYRLEIFDATHKQTHRINSPGTKTLIEIKLDASDLTGIPMRRQVWSGWPSQATDDTVIGALGIEQFHKLTVSEQVREVNRSEVTRVPSNTDMLSDDGSTADEYEDSHDIDDMFMRELPSSVPQALIPDGIEDETTAAITFADRFTQRYGHCHPMFFQGSLDDAMREACLQPAKNRKLLAVYLHHDGSISSNVFCSQVLCTESVVSFLTSNFIIWGWDLTLPSNYHKLLNMVAKHFDGLASRTLRNFVVDKWPLMLIVTRSRSTNEVLAMIPGNLNVDEMMTQLLHAVEMFSEQQRVEIAEEEERSARETVKREQDEAYQLSLQADRAKEEMRRQEEALKQQKEEEERVREAQEKRLAELSQQQKEERRLLVAKRLPPEPPANPVAKNTTCIRFRLPEGKMVNRRFLADDPFQVVLDFVLVEGFPVDEYKILSSWPRKDLSGVDTTQTMRQLNLVPQETLIIEER